jgi:hypothetical protein
MVVAVMRDKAAITPGVERIRIVRLLGAMRESSNGGARCQLIMRLA